MSSPPKKYRSFSIYKRTLFLLTGAILLIFLILAIVYYAVFNVSNKALLSDQLSQSAEALADRILAENNLDEEIFVSNTSNSYIMFAARSSKSLIWLVNRRGEIIAYSALPEISRQKLRQDNLLKLSPEYLNKGGITKRSLVSEGNFHQLLPPDEHWLSAQYRLESVSAAYAGEIIIHRSLSQKTFRAFLLNNSILIAFVVAFIVAIIVILFLSRNITRPIKRLIDTAEAVYRGDYSARVKLKKDEEVLLLGSGKSIESKDDLILLVRTFNTLISKLELQEIERKDFMASISHDLKTPITSIKGFLTGILDGTIEENQQEQYLAIISQEVSRLQKLVSKLFDISVLDNSDNLKVYSFDIHRLISEDLDGLASLLDQKNIDIVLDYKIEDEVFVKADRDAIHRVFYNILHNAIEHSPENGLIYIKTKRNRVNNEVIVSIEDSGPGIKETSLPYIFDRFYKVDHSRGSGGSGLGLYIAKTIISLHNQKIDADNSERIGGARLSFTLELVE